MGLMKNGTGALRISVRSYQTRHLRWGRKITLTIHEQSNQEESHERTFSVMHVKSVAEPFLGLAADLAFFALLVSFGNEVLSEVLGQVFRERARFRDSERLRQSRGFDRDHRRLAAMSFRVRMKNEN